MRLRTSVTVGVVAALVSTATGDRLGTSVRRGVVVGGAVALADMASRDDELRQLARQAAEGILEAEEGSV